MTGGSPPPLVLVHGLWDGPQLFDRLQAELQQRCPERQVFAPHLPHGLGQVPIRRLAAQLASLTESRFGSDTKLDVLGFSMGGVVARAWIQLGGGHRQVRRFLSVGSPQQGTLMAQLCPQRWLASIADMKVGSSLLRDLANSNHHLAGLDCHSFYTVFDGMVVPGWRAVLPVGRRYALPVLQHRQLILDPRALDALLQVLLAT